MGAATCSWCHCDAPEVDRPTMCASCGLMIFPNDAAPTEAPVAEETVAGAPLELSSWRGLARHRATPADAASDAAPVVEPVAEAAVEPVAQPVAAPAAPRAAAPRAAAPLAAAAAKPAAEASVAAAAEPVVEPRARTIVGQSVAVPSLWRSFQLTARDGVHGAAGLALYTLVALAFLAIVFRPFSPLAWAISVFVVLQGLSALAFAGARWLNRRGLVADVEEAILWWATPILPCIALNAGILTLHSLVAGLPATALVVANAILLHRKLGATLAAGPNRALLFVGTGLLAVAGLAPLVGAFPPLAACAIAVLLGRGQALVTRRAAGEPALQHYSMMKVSALLLLGALAATIALTRGALAHGAAALPVWGMFLTSLTLLFRNHCDHDPQALSADARKLLEPGVECGLVAGFVLTLGDPVGMLVTGGIAFAMLLRDSLRLFRPVLLLPAVAISLGIYAWFPDPRSAGITSLRLVVPAFFERLTGAPPLAVAALCFAPWAAALVVVHTFLVRRGHARHALFVGACALPATLATCAGMVVGASGHWLMGASLAATGALLLVCGVLASQLLAVIPGSIGLLFGVGAAAAAAGFSPAAIELALALTVLAVLLELGAIMHDSTEFARSFSRRWVDAATLFVMTAIPVALTADSLRLPSDPTTIGNELALAALSFFVAHAWRRPEAALVASALIGRACLGFLALRLSNETALRSLEIVAGAGAIPVVLWFLTPLVPLARRVVPAARPGVLWTLLGVWTIQGFGAWKYQSAIVGIEKDVPALVTLLACAVTPWLLAVVAGLRIGARRRGASPAVAA